MRDHSDDGTQRNEASDLRRTIAWEIERELDELDLEAAVRDVDVRSLAEVTSSRQKLRFVRRLLTAENLEAMDLNDLKLLHKRSGFLDREVPVSAARRMLQFHNPLEIDSELGTESSSELIDTPETEIAESGLHAESASDRLAPDPSKEGQAPVVHASTKDSQPSPPVAGKALAAWAAEWLSAPENQYATEAETLEAVRAAFPQNRIPRDRVRALRPPQKRGPKPFRGKPSAE